MRLYLAILDPKPFARLRVLVGEERRLGRLDAGARESARRELQDELDRLTAAAAL